MAVIYYQLFIVMTLLIVRVMLPKRFLVCAVIWTVLTLVNLFYPPLIAIQLLVVWVTFALLRPREESNGSVPQPVKAAATLPCDAMVDTAHTVSPAPSDSALPSVLSTQPSWANPEKLSQFKAAVIIEATSRYSLPMLYVVQFMGDEKSVIRLLSIAAPLERSGLSFEEQAVQAARRVKWKWDELSSEEREAFLADHSRLEDIKF
jgi:hypothetical protein